MLAPIGTAVLAGALLGASPSSPSLSDYAASLIERARAEQLARSREWTVLLHYEDEGPDGVESEVDSPGFFLTKEGRFSPETELEATIRAFFDPPVAEPEKEDHPQCRFPARYAWLKERLGFDAARLADRPCPRFVEWRDTLNPGTVSVIFAAAYLNSPASMFGHTLLRLNRPNRTPGSDLVAYTINFAAEPTTFNAIFYAVLGLTGGFAGRFSTTPYYLKVKEYSDLESRDIWEYELSLTPVEIERLVRHLWEVGPHTLNYFYVDENCSYQLLSLLIVARPSLRLLERFPSWVVPADTLSAVLAEPGLVVRSQFRPSRHTLMIARRAGLTGDEAALAARIARAAAPEDLELLRANAPERQAAVLDAAQELLRYWAGDEPDEEEAARERKILLTRGRVRVPASEPVVEAPRPPEAGHGTSRLSIGGGAASTGAYASLSIRPALHDLLDLQDGYAPSSMIELIPLHVRMSLDEPSLVLEQFDLVRVASLLPVDRWAFKLSWRVAGGIWRRHEGGCEGFGCLTYRVAGGPGLAFDLTTARWFSSLLYLMIDADLGAGGAFRDSYRVAGGGTAGLLIGIGSIARLQVEGGYLYPFLGEERPDPLPGPDDGPDFRLSGTLSISLTQDLALRLNALGLRGYREASGSVGIYF